ncbi:ABC transporter permease subunit [Permianibacter sp. IMCC34836]|uniref:ABC transporter permease n=1 Tax=Permianibacter fluminis TaxID=2738515 RepID=UPI00155785BD|nr:ABC transporter permease [Permianibacter fluminis]NQD36987.1 ABC transporter permease subunit [Permianibacter fluminis]
MSTAAQPISKFHAIKTLFRRELGSYFATPLALVFVVIFLVMSGVFAFEFGKFYDRNQADLLAFFSFHPWLYLFLVPAVAMRTWAEERRSGTLELLMTLPITLWQAVLAKFLAAWALLALALALTFPMWLSVNYLGDPDNGVIAAAYVGSLLMAGAFLAIGTCLSAATRSQVVAFILTVVLCFVFVLAGFPLVLNWVAGWLPKLLVDAIANLSFLTHFDSISKGVLDFRDVFFFLSFMVAWLIATAIVLDMKKAE